MSSKLELGVWLLLLSSLVLSATPRATPNLRLHRELKTKKSLV